MILPTQASDRSHRRLRTPLTRLHVISARQPRKVMADSDELDSVEELPIRNVSTTSERSAERPAVPKLFTSLPPIRDSLNTYTSQQQDQVVEDCLPFLAGIADPSKTFFDFSAGGVPRLERDDHVEFLTDALHYARFIAYDPSRPWVVYWTLTALSLLGQDVSQYGQRSVTPSVTSSYLIRALNGRANVIHVLNLGLLKHSRQRRTSRGVSGEAMASCPIVRPRMPSY